MLLSNCDRHTSQEGMLSFRNFLFMGTLKYRVHIPLIQAFQRQKQKDEEFKDNISYMEFEVSMGT